MLPGYSGQPFLPESLARLARLRELAGEDVLLQVDAASGPPTSPRPTLPAPTCSWRGAPSSTVATRPSPTPTLSVSPADARQLERALGLAERGRGTTRPNPIVGAVVVADGEVAGEGWHERKGLPHAEVIALERAGQRARGATLYVTLEPCAHHGATPPCADAVIAAGVARVVAAAADPNPKTNGQGFERLRTAGIEVELPGGELSGHARVQNEGYRAWVAEGRPFVTYKAAVTLDGKVAAAGGDARWVSGEESRRHVHELRARADAVAVGMGTVAGANPLLTVRDVALSASRAGSRSARGGYPKAPSLSCAPVRSPRSSPRWPPKASRRSCSRVALRWPLRSCMPA